MGFSRHLYCLKVDTFTDSTCDGKYCKALMRMTLSLLSKCVVDSCQCIRKRDMSLFTYCTYLILFVTALYHLDCSNYIIFGPTLYNDK